MKKSKNFIIHENKNVARGVVHFHIFRPSYKQEFFSINVYIMLFKKEIFDLGILYILFFRFFFAL